MHTFLTILHVLTCIFLILVILLQEARISGIGIAFGSGGGGQVFGGSSSSNLLVRITTVTALVFAVTSASLAYLSSQQDVSGLEGKTHHDNPASEPSGMGTPPVAPSSAPATSQPTTPVEMIPPPGPATSAPAAPAAPAPAAVPAPAPAPVMPGKVVAPPAHPAAPAAVPPAAPKAPPAPASAPARP
jgi:preprotein translocase subunit SecG